jgi:hypothetical protein
MKGTEKTKEQLLEELVELCQRNDELEAMGTRQQVLSQVRDEIWKMESSKDIENILTAMVDSLRRTGVAFTDCGINLVDSSLDPPTVVGYTIDEGKVRAWNSTFPEIIVRLWRTGAPVLCTRQ